MADSDQLVFWSSKLFQWFLLLAGAACLAFMVYNLIATSVLDWLLFAPVVAICAIFGALARASARNHGPVTSDFMDWLMVAVVTTIVLLIIVHTT